MNNINGIQAFVKSAELGSFVAAGRALAISPSAVGKSVARLEQDVGVRLLQRSTRRLQLTAEGQMFHERCRRILEDLDDAQTLLSRSKESPRGKLRVSAPVVGYHFLVPILPEFLNRYPDVELDIIFTDRAVDLIHESVDVAIRSGDLPDSQYVSRPLQRFRLLLCATPAYLKRHGLPASMHEMSQHVCIRFRHPDTGKLLDWPLREEWTGRPLALRTALACNNIEAVFNATLRSIGIACLPDFLVKDTLSEGRLTSVLEHELGPSRQFWALWPSSRHLSPKVRAFVDHLGARLSTPEPHR